MQAAQAKVPNSQHMDYFKDELEYSNEGGKPQTRVALIIIVNRELNRHMQTLHMMCELNKGNPHLNIRCVQNKLASP